MLFLNPSKGCVVSINSTSCISIIKKVVSINSISCISIIKKVLTNLLLNANIKLALRKI